MNNGKLAGKKKLSNSGLEQVTMWPPACCQLN